MRAEAGALGQPPDEPSRDLIGFVPACFCVNAPGNDIAGVVVACVQVIGIDHRVVDEILVETLGRCLVIGGRIR